MVHLSRCIRSDSRPCCMRDSRRPPLKGRGLLNFPHFQALQAKLEKTRWGSLHGHATCSKTDTSPTAPPKGFAHNSAGRFANGFPTFGSTDRRLRMAHPSGSHAPLANSNHQLRQHGSATNFNRTLRVVWRASRRWQAVYDRFCRPNTGPHRVFKWY